MNPYCSVVPTEANSDRPEHVWVVPVAVVVAPVAAAAVAAAVDAVQLRLQLLPASYSGVC